MNHREAKHIASSFLYVLCLFLIGCGGADDQRYGEWTMKEAPLQLTEDLRVSETETFYFGTVSDLDVTTDGKIVIADRQANNLKVLRPDGSLLDTLGGSGEGPGEFQMLSSIQVGRGDSIYAQDLQQSRLTVFDAGSPYEVSRMISIPREKGLMGAVYVVGDRLAGSFSSGTAPEDGVTRPAPGPLRLLDESGVPGDTLLLDRSTQAAFSFGESGGFTAESVPFSRETVHTVGPSGRLYFGWTDSLHIQARTPKTDAEVVASVPTDPIPITAADRDSALSDVDDKLRSMVASALPETKPAFTDLVVDDTGALWVKRPAKTPDAVTVSWWILKPESKTIRTAQLPANVELNVVRDGRAYGTTTTEMDAPAVVRYRIQAQAE